MVAPDGVRAFWMSGSFELETDCRERTGGTLRWLRFELPVKLWSALPPFNDSAVDVNVLVTLTPELGLGAARAELGVRLARFSRH